MFKGHCFPKEIILQAVYFKLRFSLSYRDVEELLSIRGVKRIRIKQCKYLNNRVEGDHRFIKWRTQSMLGFKSFKSASRTLSGIETVRMIKKEQLYFPLTSAYKSFCS